MNEELGGITSPPPHLSDLPVNIPLLHVSEPPCGGRQARGHVDADQAVVRNAENLLLLTAFESETQKDDLSNEFVDDT